MIWTVEHRAFIVDKFIQNESVTSTQKAFRERFEFGESDPVPTRNTILQWVAIFKASGSISRKPRPPVKKKSKRRSQDAKTSKYAEAKKDKFKTNKSRNKIRKKVEKLQFPKSHEIFIKQENDTVNTDECEENASLNMDFFCANISDRNKHFLLSLLPEMEKMSVQQNLDFRIEVTSVLKDIVMHIPQSSLHSAMNNDDAALQTPANLLDILNDNSVEDLFEATECKPII